MSDIAVDVSLSARRPTPGTLFHVIGAVLMLVMFTARGDESPLVRVAPAGSQPSTTGPAQYFTGNVRVDGRFQGSNGARVSGGTVTFEPGARTAWHTHPLGQTLIVTAGVGRVQQEDQPIQVIRPGDTVWIPPGVKHWHGAAATNGMSHVAIAELLDGSAVQWLEQVSNEDYAKAL
jgi:quercetin dioxygenase-like cupin family protein